MIIPVYYQRDIKIVQSAGAEACWYKGEFNHLLLKHAGNTVSRARISHQKAGREGLYFRSAPEAVAATYPGRMGAAEFCTVPGAGEKISHCINRAGKKHPAGRAHQALRYPGVRPAAPALDDDRMQGAGRAA